MSSINPVAPGSGGGLDPNRKKTPEERQAEIDERRKKWEAIRQQIEVQAAATKEQIRARVNLPHQGQNIDVDA